MHICISTPIANKLMGSKRTASAAAHKLPKSNAKHSKRQKLENNEATNRDERPLKKGGRLSTVVRGCSEVLLMATILNNL